MRYLLVCLLAITLTSVTHAEPKPRYYYQLKIYLLKNATQKQALEKYLETAYVPALHRAGIKKVGVFNSPASDSVQRVYVLTPFSSWNAVLNTVTALEKDKEYLTAGKEYLEADHKVPPYERIETVLMEAFEGMPEPAVPVIAGNKADRIYELRSYQSATENYFANKVKMFNTGEMEIFQRLQFNAVFYGSVIAGSHTPNLMYMTSFTNMASRDQHWKAFSDDPAWKKLSADPVYQNNVSRIDIFLLSPAAYSDF